MSEASPADLERVRRKLEAAFQKPEAGVSGNGQATNGAGVDIEALKSRLSEAFEIRSLLERNSEELLGVVRALNGEYILPEPGGDLLRDGAGVLPTGGFSLGFWGCRFRVF